MSDATLYRNTVGALQYLAITRPDIAIVVNKYSQFMQNPHDIQWTAVKHILLVIACSLGEISYLGILRNNLLFLDLAMKLRRKSLPMPPSN